MTIWDDRYKSGEGLRWWPNEELVRFLGKTYGDMRQVPCRGMQAIELGCGTGCNMIALTGFGFFPWGYDASRDAILTAQEYLSSWALPTDYRWELQQVHLPERLPAGDEAFDLVVDCQTIQHLSDEDHVKVYAEVARVLKPGGRFWSMHWRGGNSNKIYAGAYPELHMWYLDELMNMMSRAGFNNYAIDGLMRHYDAYESKAEWFIISAVKR